MRQPASGAFGRAASAEGAGTAPFWPGVVRRHSLRDDRASRTSGEEGGDRTAGGITGRLEGPADAAQKKTVTGTRPSSEPPRVTVKVVSQSPGIEKNSDPA
ncbi:MAG: hypothetical protein RJA59_825 [Pseudomonadota bacterium]